MPVAAWLLAARPKTLLAGVAPVIVGSALGAAAAPRGLAWLPAFGCLTGAILIQVATNYINDAIDARTGADDERRVGPRRAVASGLIPSGRMLTAGIGLLLIAFLIGWWLSLIGGPIILVLGIVSLLCAYGYTGGPLPLAYVGLGDLFVWLFFGLFAVLGSAWVQVAPATADGLGLSEPLLLGLPLGWWTIAAGIGFQATAIIAVNNLRDRVTDATVGKRTLAVRLGGGVTRWYYLALHVLAGGAYAVAAVTLELAWLWTAAGCAWVLGIIVSLLVWRREGAALNPLLGASAGIELLCAAVLASVVLLGSGR